MRGRQLGLVATTSAVLRPIALTGLGGILSIAPTVHEATAAST
jgi:anti-anti-sigma regulatory factor